MKTLFFICMLACGLAYADGSETYRTRMGESELIVISLKKGEAPSDKLLAKNSNEEAVIRNTAIPPNEHNVMLIKNPKFTALVDSGYENTRDKLETALKKAGTGADQITHVILTHAHPDHIGGMINGSEKQFKNAKLLMDKREFDYWINGKNARTKEILTLYGGDTVFFKPGEHLLGTKAPALILVAAYGHTPGHNMIRFEHGDERLVFIGDLLHVYAVQKDYPQISIGYDVEPEQAAQIRTEFIHRFKREKTPLVGAHMPGVKPVVLN